MRECNPTRSSDGIDEVSSSWNSQTREVQVTSSHPYSRTHTKSSTTLVIVPVYDFVMGERKVLNKYIPADFDPALVPRGKKLSKKDGTVPVRMMLPFSIQCSTCNTFLYRGRKFNSKKEPMGGPDGRYLGIQRFRFYIKCTHCSRTVSFLTDPKNADYEMESGGTRNYEVYKDKEKTEEESAQEKEEDEKLDPMRALENRVLDSQREIADLDNLEEIRAMNRKHVQLLSSAGEGFDADAKAVMHARDSKIVAQKEDVLTEHGITEEEEQLVKSIKFGRNNYPGDGPKSIVRLDEIDEKREEDKRRRELMLIQERQRELEKKASLKNSVPSRPLIKVKRKRINGTSENQNIIKKTKVEEASTVHINTQQPANNSSTNQPQGNVLASLLGGYGSSSESD
jgi:hypothetical protein